MKASEKEMYNSITGKSKKLTEDDIYGYIETEEEAAAFVDVLFRVLNTIIEEYPRTKKLYNINTIFEYIMFCIEHGDVFDSSVIQNKINKVDKRIDLIISKKINKRRELIEELRGVKRGLKKVSEKSCEESTHRYDFINYLIKESRNIKFIEFAFINIPDVMHAKDKLGIPLFRNLTRSFIESVKADDIKNSSYYKSLIGLMLSQKSFALSEDERKGILYDIYLELEKISNNQISKNVKREMIKQLESIKEIIAPKKEQDLSLDETASKYGIDIAFPNGIVDLVDDYKKPITLDNYPDRRAFKDYIVSIDGATAVEIDDALSCTKAPNGHYFLGVHIASVLGYYDYNSQIVENAFNRVKSIYLGKSSYEGQSMIPIFPEEFSTNIGALVEGENRLARSYLFEIDQNGNIVDQRFVKTIIRNNKRATYKEINDIIRNGSSNVQLNRTVQNLKEVSEILRKKHHTDQLYELVKERTPDPAGLRVKMADSEDIVYQCMLLTGNKVAEFFASHDYPCLYRVHNIDKSFYESLFGMVRKMVDKHGETDFERMYEFLEGMYPKGYYSISGNHQGLGFNNYCHCTSGLRRAADIVVEHALEVCYDFTPTEEELAELAADIKAKQQIINLKSDSIDWFVGDFNKVLVKDKARGQRSR